MFSAPHPTTDIALTGRHVGFVPIVLKKAPVATQRYQ
jgi:hypothetical protein